MAAYAILPFFLSIAMPQALAASADGAMFDQARQLIVSGRAAEARALLAAHELEYAGEAGFDYLYGIAQLDSGDRAAAIGTFERLLAADPADAPARLELGRALYESGDRAGAERQLIWLLSQNPPPRVRDAAEAYLRALQPRESTGDGWSGAFEFGAGYDTNANASTDAGDFFGIILDPTNVETESAFGSLAFSAGNLRALGERNRLRTAARIGHRWNENADFVDQTLASLDTVFEFGDGPTIFTLGVGGHYGLLDEDAHQWGAGGDLGFSRSFGDGWLARGILRYAVLRYDEDIGSLSALDFDRTVGAFTLWRAQGDNGFGLTAIAGQDDPTTSGSPYANDRLGLQFDAVAGITGGHGLRFQLGWLEVDYDEDPPFFGVLERADEIWSAAVSGEFRDWPMRGWHLLPRAGWLRNDSTIPLYEYDRFEFSLTLQRPF